MWSSKLTGYIHRLYRADPWLQALYGSAGTLLDEIESGIREWHENRYFDGYTFALPIWERILGMRPGRSQGDESRKAALRAKWLMNRKSDRALLQDIADSWQRDALKVGFDAGYITLIADGTILRDWRYLLSAINEAKPAHLPLVPVIRSHSTLYFGGTLMPYYQSATLPQHRPSKPLQAQASANGTLGGIVTIKLPEYKGE